MYVCAHVCLLCKGLSAQALPPLCTAPWASVGTSHKAVVSVVTATTGRTGRRRCTVHNLHDVTI